jgi:hypothetical protein
MGNVVTLYNLLVQIVESLEVWRTPMIMIAFLLDQCNNESNMDIHQEQRYVLQNSEFEL